MNPSLTKSVCCVIATGVLLAGCQNMSPETQGILGGLGAGAAAGGIASAAGANASTATAIGLATGAAVGALVYVLAKHEATERQRRYAEERARLAYQQMPAAQRERVRKRRYIAVSTVREANSTGANSVMVYDTQTQQVVGNNVYDVKTPPKDGDVGKFDTYTAEYVATGP